MSLRPAVVAALGVLMVGGCTQTGTPDADATTETVEETTPISVTIPAERTTPFCSALIELNDRLLTDPEVDAEALIIETYRSVLADVPAEIETDFQAVLTELETGVPAPTLPPVTQPDLPPATDPDTGVTLVSPDDTIEYFFPSPTPAQRVNDYVAFACRDATNNPGPPPTVPGEDDVDTEGDDAG